MADRRMFSKTIINSDSFLDLPIASQLLYFHLSMDADDDGFVNKTKSILRTVGCSENDLIKLIKEKFIIPFESGIIVIRHWRVHNYIKKDRYKPTVYINEKSKLSADETGAYIECNQSDGSEAVPNRFRSGSASETQDRTELESGKSKGNIMGEKFGEFFPTKTKRFVPPSSEEVRKYCAERENGINADNFIDYYTANGWMVGKNKMKDWRAAVRTWEKRGGENSAYMRESKETPFRIQGGLHL